MIYRYWTGDAEIPRSKLYGNITIDLRDEDLPEEIQEWVFSRDNQVHFTDWQRHRANLVRLWLIVEHGGTWLDYDCDVSGELPDGDWIATSNLYPCMSAFSLPADHPLLWEMLIEIEDKPASHQYAPYVSGQDVWWQKAQYLKDVEFIEFSPDWLTHRFETSKAIRRGRR